jgi:hypothetical protein
MQVDRDIFRYEIQSGSKSGSIPGAHMPTWATRAIMEEKIGPLGRGMYAGQSKDFRKVSESQSPYATNWGHLVFIYLGSQGSCLPLREMMQYEISPFDVQKISWIA